VILVEEYECFIEGARLDWLHPSHGRWPDLAARFLRDKEDKEGFLVAVWWDGRAYSVIVEGLEERHSIIQTYRWVPSNRDRTVWWCRLYQHHGAELDTSKDAAIRIRQIANASCELFMDY